MAMLMVVSRVRRRGFSALLRLAQVGYAHWLFGNLYESVVRVPDRLSAEDARMASILSPGSPVRYYLPGIPVVIGATVAALVGGWKSHRDRALLGMLAASTCSGLALTAYLVRAVNLKLFVAGQTVSAAERQRLLHTWYRLNAVRLLSAGTAWLVAGRLSVRARDWHV